MNGIDDQQGPAEVLYRYARAIDTKDWDLLRGCFQPTCVFAAGQLVLDGVDAIVEFMERAHEHIDGSQHRLSNVRIEPDSDGRSSRSWTYLDAFIVHAAHRDGPTFHLIAEYQDRLELAVSADGGALTWVIAQRDVKSLWSAGSGSILGPA